MKMSITQPTRTVLPIVPRPPARNNKFMLRCEQKRIFASKKGRRESLLKYH